jgi:hypothetical protein
MVELRRYQKAGDVLLERFRRGGEGLPTLAELDGVVRQVEGFLRLPVGPKEAAAVRKKAHVWLAAAAMRWAVDIEPPEEVQPLTQPGSQDGGYRPLSSSDRSLALQRAIHHYGRAFVAEPLDLGSAVGEGVARAIFEVHSGEKDNTLPEDLRMIQRACLRLLEEADPLEGTHSQIALYGYLGLMALLLREDAIGYFGHMVKVGTSFHFTCFSNGRSIRRIATLGPKEVQVEAKAAWKLLERLGVPERWTEATSWWKTPGAMERK